MEEEEDGTTQGEMEECGVIITKEYRRIHKRKRKTGKSWYKTALPGPNVST